MSIPLLKTLIQNAHDVQKLVPFMAKNVLVNLLSQVLVAVGFFIH
jgi:hypothetical protein